MNDLDLVPFTDESGGYGPGSAGRHRRKKSDRSSGKTLVALLVVVAVLGGIVLGGWYGVNKVRDLFSAEDYPGPGSGEVTVTIDQGASVTDIANVLYENDVVASAKAFVNAAEDNPDSTTKLIPGQFTVKKQMKAEDALLAMMDPKSRIDDPFVIIPEGLTVVEILPRLAKETGLPVEAFKEAAKDPAALGVPEWGGPTPENRRLEGFLFPGRYEFGEAPTADGLLKEMVARAVKAATDDQLAERASALGMSEWELLIVASLVEQEGIAKDFAKVARVIYNRLETDEPGLQYLQFDSTSQYWLIINGKSREAKITDAVLKDPDNIYSTDTNMHEGLPPTPIGNPGDDALKAAANPEEGDWLYFVVTGKDRSSGFASNYSEHQDNVQKCKDIGIC